jgi:hypothetical protein
MEERVRRHGAGAAAGGLAATVVVAVMMVGAVSMWTVIPFGWIWIGSMISESQEPSGGPYMVVFFGIVCSIIAMAWALSRLNQLYVRITGSAKLPSRYLPAWRKSLSDQRDMRQGPNVLEAVILGSVLLAGAALAVWFFIAAGSPLPSQ